jgi:hypothetical protein
VSVLDVGSLAALASMLKLFDLKKKKDEGKDDPGAGSAGEPLLASPSSPVLDHPSPHQRCSPFTSGMLAGQSLCSTSPAVTSLPSAKAPLLGGCCPHTAWRSHTLFRSRARALAHL